jgi:hypothetical protein
LWRCYVFGPFPVGLVASVAAFITEGLFIDPNVVAVPGEEVSSVVNVKSLVNMGSWREIRRFKIISVYWIRSIPTKSSYCDKL